MKDTTAFAIARELKALGFKVTTPEAPVYVACKARYRDDSDHLAVVGAPGMSEKDVKTCLDLCRKRIQATCDCYTLDWSGEKPFEGASFAAW